MDNIDDIEKVSMRILEKSVAKLKEDEKKTQINLSVKIGKAILVLTAEKGAKKGWNVNLDYTKGE